MNTFSSLLSLACRDRNLTQIELATGSGVDASTISRIERGRTEARLFIAYLICHQLSLTLYDVAKALLGSDLTAYEMFPSTVSLWQKKGGFLCTFLENRI